MSSKDIRKLNEPLLIQNKEGSMSFFLPRNESIEEKQFPLLRLIPDFTITGSSQRKKPFDRFVYSYTTDSKALDNFVSDLLLELELTRPAKQSKTLMAVLMNLIYC